jgi:hypothetical protein
MKIISLAAGFNRPNKKHKALISGSFQPKGKKNHPFKVPESRQGRQEGEPHIL